MTVWLTADLHLGHRNIIDFCSRPFRSIDEMDNALISSLRKVRTDDTLYILGDFAWGDKLASIYKEVVLARVPNTIFIRGNHDKRSLTTLESDYIKYNGVKYVLTHYPYQTVSPGVVNLHGHCHGTSRSKPWRFDVGVDAVGYTPVSLDWVAERTWPFTREDEGELVKKIVDKYQRYMDG